MPRQGHHPLGGWVPFPGRTPAFGPRRVPSRPGEAWAVPCGSGQGRGPYALSPFRGSTDRLRAPLRLEEGGVDARTVALALCRPRKVRRKPGLPSFPPRSVRTGRERPIHPAWRSFGTGRSRSGKIAFRGSLAMQKRASHRLSPRGCLDDRKRTLDQRHPFRGLDPEQAPASCRRTAIEKASLLAATPSQSPDRSKLRPLNRRTFGRRANPTAWTRLQPQDRSEPRSSNCRTLHREANLPAPALRSFATRANPDPSAAGRYAGKRTSQPQPVRSFRNRSEPRSLPPPDVRLRGEPLSLSPFAVSRNRSELRSLPPPERLQEKPKLSSWRPVAKPVGPKPVPSPPPIRFARGAGPSRRFGR